MRRFDVVNVVFLHDWGFSPGIMAKGCFVATAWGSDIVPPPGEAPPGEELVELRRDLLRCAAGVTVCGPTFAGITAKFAGIDLDRIDLTPLGVDTDLFCRQKVGSAHPTPGYHGMEYQTVPPHRSGTCQVFRVGFFKGFRRVYGPTYLLRAISTVVEVIQGTRFHLIGDGPDLMRCKELSGLYDVEDAVKWIRPQPHRNLPNYLSMWDVTVIPSLCESFGVSALESLAMEVPVVASDVGGLRDTVLDGQTGIRVPRAAPEALADAIIQLLTHPEQRRQMGQAGRAFVQQNYEHRDMLDRTVATYQAIHDRVAVMV